MTRKSFNWRNVAAIVACLAVTIMMFWSCSKEGDNSSKSITISNSKDLKQTAYADEENTGKGFTFTAKSEWKAKVKEESMLKSSSVSWITLLCDGVETYSGDAGTFTITIVVKPNMTGQTRKATITITCDDDEIVITVTQDGKTKSGDGALQKSRN